MSVLARLCLLLCLGLPVAACGDPCGDLEVKVCQPTNPRLKREYAPLCKLMQEPTRRESLPKRTCGSILQHLSKR